MRLAHVYEVLEAAIILSAKESLVVVTDAVCTLLDASTFEFARQLREFDYQTHHAPSGQLYDLGQFIDGENFCPNLSSERRVST